MTMILTSAVVALIHVLLSAQIENVLGGVCSYDLYDSVSRPRLHDCAPWAAKGDCEANALWMKPNCAKSCGQLCGGPCPHVLNCGPVDLSIVLDSSVSVGDENFLRSKDFLLRLLSCLDVSAAKTHMSLITYGRGVYTEQAINFDSYNNNWEALNERISSIKYIKGTYTGTGDGIAYMLDQQSPQARPGVPLMCVVVTDGESQDWRKTAREAQRAKDANVTMFAVGVGGKVSVAELKRIATDDDHVFEAPSFEALGEITGKLRADICIEVTSPCPAEIQRCYKHAELMLVLDTSTSISRTDFKQGMNFLADFIKSFDVAPQKTRVAALLYSTDVWADDVINFDRTDADAVDDAIRNLPRRGGNTYTGKGIKFMVDNFLPNTRKGFPKIAIVMTDGVAHDPEVAIQQADIARAKGVTVIALGVGSGINKEELQKIAGDGGTVLTADDFDKLDNIKSQLILKSCSG